MKRNWYHKTFLAALIVVVSLVCVGTGVAQTDLTEAVNDSLHVWRSHEGSDFVLVWYKDTRCVSFPYDENLMLIKTYVVPVDLDSPDLSSAIDSFTRTTRLFWYDTCSVAYVDADTSCSYFVTLRIGEDPSYDTLAEFCHPNPLPEDIIHLTAVHPGGHYFTYTDYSPRHETTGSAYHTMLVEMKSRTEYDNMATLPFCHYPRFSPSGKELFLNVLVNRSDGEGEKFDGAIYDVVADSLDWPLLDQGGDYLYRVSCDSPLYFRMDGNVWRRHLDGEEEQLTHVVRPECVVGYRLIHDTLLYGICEFDSTGYLNCDSVRNDTIILME